MSNQETTNNKFILFQRQLIKGNIQNTCVAKINVAFRLEHILARFVVTIFQLQRTVFYQWEGNISTPERSGDAKPIFKFRKNVISRHL